MSDHLKNVIVFWGSFVSISVLLGGAMTSFKFNDLDTQLHDTYFVIPSIYIIISIIIILWILRGVFLLVEVGIRKSKFFAILVAIVNMFFIFMLVAATYLSIEKLRLVKRNYPDLSISSYVALISVMVGFACFLILIEFKTIKKIRT
jgi:heme/copper-type cytochrome/quinol oxidase subunit 1